MRKDGHILKWLNPEYRKKQTIAHLGKTQEESSHWKGGRTIASTGYVIIHLPYHPKCHKNKYYPEHRFVIEKEIGRYLYSNETVHHINEIKTDNRPENLIAFISKSAHIRFHFNPENVRPEEIIYDGRMHFKFL